MYKNLSAVSLNIRAAAYNHVHALDVALPTVFFLHLMQSTWRKIQALGLSNSYKSDEAFHVFCGMLDGLAFWPVVDVIAWLLHLTQLDKVW